EQSTVTLDLVMSRAEGRIEKTFPVAKDVKITRDGKEVKLTDLTKGNRVTLTMAPDQKAVAGISASGFTVSAELKSVDLERKAITVIANTRNGKEDKSYALAKDAKVT